MKILFFNFSFVCVFLSGIHAFAQEVRVAFTDGVNANRIASDYKKEVVNIPANHRLTIKMAQGEGFTARIYPVVLSAQSDIVEMYPIPQAVLDKNGQNVYFPLEHGASDLSGMLHDATVFIQEQQLKKEVDWVSFVQVFRDHWDDVLFSGGVPLMSGWSGEFWGKVMRGACLTYEYTQDAELYAVMETTVRDLLTTTDPNIGFINSSTGRNEFMGLAIWNMKYVLLGLEYFYDICPDETLKAKILEVLVKEADYILKHIGPEPGQIPINKSCRYFRSATSVSILEPMVRMYQMTGAKKYLDFAEYILTKGGEITDIQVDSDGTTVLQGDTSFGNVFEHAKRGVFPYQYFNYPHAYTLMSCFEGVLEYYRVTKNPEWLQVLYNFYYAIIDTDITVLGATGTSLESLNNAVIRQTMPGTRGAMDDNFIQEMCANVTWIKLSYQMLRLTGNPIIVDQIERAAYNMLLGTINYNKINIGGPLWNNVTKTYNGGAACFAGFSPINCSRIRKYGGVRLFPSSYGNRGWHYTCCMANGANGTGILPLVNVLRSDTGFAMNMYMPGTTNVKAPSGNNVVLETVTNYPYDGEIVITVNPVQTEVFDIDMRIPEWSRMSLIKVNGAPVSGVSPGTYKTITREWKAGDLIELCLDMRTQIIKAPDGKGWYEALQRGPIVLVHDQRFGGNVVTSGNNSGLKADRIKRTETYSLRLGFDGVYFKDDYECVNVKPSTSKMNFNRMEFEVPTENGDSFKVCDYASAGNDWSSFITTWFEVPGKIPPFDVEDRKIINK